MPIVYTRKRLRAPPPPPQTPPRTSETATPQPKVKRKRYTQLFIDAGQRDLVKTCPTCYMVYSPGKDDHIHNRYHRASKLPRWSPRTNARSVGKFAEVDIYILKESCVKTVRRVDEYVSHVLGTVLNFPAGVWIAVIAVAKGLVRAFCLAERIKKAGLLTGCGVVEGMEKAIMGVRKIWVDEQFRGNGIATRLVEEACLALSYGHVVERHFVAFSVPTADGTKFANRFGDGRVLVYDTADADATELEQD